MPLSDTGLLERLVRFDSVSRNSNLPIADFLCNYLDGPTVQIHRNPSADGDKTNLLIWAGPEADVGTRAGLILSGHMDVVPADEDKWMSDPFVATARDGRWIGRGTADMKGFLALAANVFSEFEAHKASAPLGLLLTYDEELGTFGAKRFVETWTHPYPLPRNAIIGEPTSLRPIRMHKGHLTVRFTVFGQSAHSGLPHLGKNAIEPAATIVTALSALREEPEQERPETGAYFPEVPFLAINVGEIHGGSAINVVPDECHVDVGVRTLPQGDPDELIERMRATADAAVGVGGYTFTLLGNSPPLLLGRDAPIHQAVCEETLSQYGEGVAYATDAGWFQNLDMDCLIFGPGSIEVAHKPNEWISQADLVMAKEHLNHLVQRFCFAERESRDPWLQNPQT